MQKIVYAGSSFVTGDAIAEALATYAAYLMRTRTFASIDIPIRKPDGSDSRAFFLLGPSSELVLRPEPSDRPELEHDGVVDELWERASRGALASITSGEADRGSLAGRHFTI